MPHQKALYSDISDMTASSVHSAYLAQASCRALSGTHTGELQVYQPLYIALYSLAFSLKCFQSGSAAKFLTDASVKLNQVT